MKSYDMRQQLKKGEAAERYLDSLFEDEFAIRPATRQQQRQGIDRIFTRRSDGREYRIEYKADKTAARTGNAFVETVSVDTYSKPGWAYTCRSDYIFYYVVGDGPVYILKPADIKRRLDRWAAQYEKRRIPNSGYHTEGLLVPLEEFEKMAIQIVPG